MQRRSASSIATDQIDWVRTDSSLISCSGLFLGLTGTFSIVSKVESDPSITLSIENDGSGRSLSVEPDTDRDLPTENGVFPIERRLFGISDEELKPCCQPRGER